jgi:hypothetical protein
MKSEFEAYLHRTDMPSSVIIRANELFELYKAIFTDEIQDIFVEEYVDAGGSREFKSLHFFSENLDYEIGNFLFNDKIFIIPIKNNIDDIRIVERDHYDLIKAIDPSKLIIRLTLSGGNSILDLYATKENCNQLTKLLKNYFFPNFFL